MSCAWKREAREGELLDSGHHSLHSGSQILLCLWQSWCRILQEWWGALCFSRWRWVWVRIWALPPVRCEARIHSHSWPGLVTDVWGLSGTLSSDLLGQLVFNLCEVLFEINVLEYKLSVFFYFFLMCVCVCVSMFVCKCACRCVCRCVCALVHVEARAELLSTLLSFWFWLLIRVPQFYLEFIESTKLPVQQLAGSTCSFSVLGL